MLGESDDWGAVAEGLVCRERVAAVAAEVDVATRLTLVQLRELQSRCNCNRARLHQSVSRRSEAVLLVSLTTMQGDRHALRGRHAMHAPPQHHMGS